MAALYSVLRASLFRGIHLYTVPVLRADRHLLQVA
jgi:hypothetical protein